MGGIHLSSHSETILIVSITHFCGEMNYLETVNVLKFRTPKFLTKWQMQTVQTQIRLLLKEQSDQGLHCLPFATA